MKKIVIKRGVGLIGSTEAGILAYHNEILLFDNLARNTIQHNDMSKHKNVSLVQGVILVPCRSARR